MKKPQQQEINNYINNVILDRENEVISFLDKYPDYIDTLDNSGWTGLMNAAWYGAHDVLDILLTRGADIHAVQKSGENALMLSVKKGNLQAAQTLLENGAHINDRCHVGRTALIHGIASSNSSKEIASFLINHGADINVCDSMNHTALFYAGMMGDKDTIELLIDRGADASIVSRAGKTAADMTHMCGHTALAEFIREKADEKIRRDAEAKKTREEELHRKTDAQIAKIKSTPRPPDAKKFHP